MRTQRTGELAYMNIRASVEAALFSEGTPVPARAATFNHRLQCFVYHYDTQNTKVYPKKRRLSIECTING